MVEAYWNIGKSIIEVYKAVLFDISKWSRIL